MERNKPNFQNVTLHFEYSVTFKVHLVQRNVSCEVNHTNQKVLFFAFS
jgi:hypothetical protein